MLKPKKIKKINTGYIQRSCGITACVFEEVTSTNAILKEYARQGAPEWTLVVADSQTEGRGRGDHTFFSPKGSGVYISLLLRPKSRVFSPADITAAAGVAACEAVESLSDRKAQIKWMNDIFCDGKKVAGILAESVLVGNDCFVVVGIGFNLTTPDGGFPEELADKADSIFGERPIRDLREKMTVAFFRQFEKRYRRSEGVYRAYRDRLFVLGCAVTYEGKSAVVTDLASDYRLELTLESGEKVYLNSGEISLSHLI